MKGRQFELNKQAQGSPCDVVLVKRFLPKDGQHPFQKKRCCGALSSLSRTVAFVRLNTIKSISFVLFLGNTSLLITALVSLSLSSIGLDSYQPC